MIWPRTRGAIPTTLARATASSVRGCRSFSFQTQNDNTTAAAITTMLKRRPARTRPGLGLAFGASVESASDSFRSCMSASIEDESNAQSEDDPERQVHEPGRTQVRVNLEGHEHLPNEHGQDDPDDDADHPGREVGSEDVDLRGMSGHGCPPGFGAGFARSPTVSARVVRLT